MDDPLLICNITAMLAIVVCAVDDHVKHCGCGAVSRKRRRLHTAAVDDEWDNKLGCVAFGLTTIENRLFDRRSYAALRSSFLRLRDRHLRMHARPVIKRQIRLNPTATVDMFISMDKCVEEYAFDSIPLPTEFSPFQLQRMTARQHHAAQLKQLFVNSIDMEQFSDAASHVQAGMWTFMVKSPRAFSALVSEKTKVISEPSIQRCQLFSKIQQILSVTGQDNSFHCVVWEARSVYTSTIIHQVCNQTKPDLVYRMLIQLMGNWSNAQYMRLSNTLHTVEVTEGSQDCWNMMRTNDSAASLQA